MKDIRKVKVIYIRLAIMTSLLVDRHLSFSSNFWFAPVKSAANVIWREILNGIRRESKRSEIKVEVPPGFEPWSPGWKTSVLSSTPP